MNRKKEKIWSEKYIFDGAENDRTIKDMAESLGVSEIFAVLLRNRGYDTAEKAGKFLRFETTDFHDPYLLDDIDVAIERIKRALADKEKMCIYGDYDVDGVTSVSMLYLYLTSLGGDVTIKIPKRDGEGYGMSCAAIDVLSDSGVSLIITVDTGITANEEINYARELGIEVIVTDHHECRPELPEAVAVINPHREDSKYPFCELAGVGVVFKLICAYEMMLCRQRGEAVLSGITRICSEYADLAAIGTIADVMPIVDENRLIVSMGLKLLEKTHRLGLEELIDAASATKDGGTKKRKISSSFIGFGIAPRINAAGRISDSQIAVNLLLENDRQRAREYAQELCDINKLRQIEENKIAEEAYEMIESSHKYDGDVVLVLENDEWQQGIIGIVSSRITEKYGLPSILISFKGATSGEPSPFDFGKGSGRSVKGMNLVAALNYCEDVLEKYGGHELAAGLTVKRANIDEFRRKINEYAGSHMTDEMFKVCIDADCELGAHHITLALAQEILSLEPFGTGNPTPLFVMRDVTVQRIMQMGAGKHTKLLLDKDGTGMCGVYFGVSAGELSFDVGDKIDLLFSLDINDFRNVKSVQLLVRDATISDSYRKNIEEEKRRYEQIKDGAVYEPEEEIIPERDDFVRVYNALRREFRSGTNVIDTKMLQKLVNSIDQPEINYIKLKYILTIMNELKLCRVEEIDDDIYSFEVIFSAAKTSIDKSSILKRLKSRCSDRYR